MLVSLPDRLFPEADYLLFDIVARDWLVCARYVQSPERADKMLDGIEVYGKHTVDLRAGLLSI